MEAGARSQLFAVMLRDGGKMVNPTRGTIDLGGSMPSMPNLRLAGSRLLQIVIAIVILLVLWWSTTSIPTGNVGVLTLFGRVTGETLAEGIHLINEARANTGNGIP